MLSAVTELAKVPQAQVVVRTRTQATADPPPTIKQVQASRLTELAWSLGTKPNTCEMQTSVCNQMALSKVKNSLQKQISSENLNIDRNTI